MRFTFKENYFLLRHFCVKRMQSHWKSVSFACALELIFILGTSPSAYAGTNEVTLIGLEVTQAIQDLNDSNPWDSTTNNTVTLIANKRTVVRAYFDTTSSSLLALTGTLQGSRSAGAALMVNSANTLNLSTAITPTGRLPSKREKLPQSLTFELTEAWTAQGGLTLKIQQVADATGIAVSCSNCSTKSVSVTFISSPPLKVRFIQLRYTSPINDHEYLPREADLALIRSWLRRAYPIAQLEEAPEMVADLSLLTPSDFTADAANSKVDSVRGTEISNGEDPLVRYIGLVYDPYEDDTRTSRDPSGPCPSSADLTGMEFRGGANVAAGDQYLVDNVASAPVGPPGIHCRLGLDTTWDLDGSYGDWYTGHELAHLFLGRNHVQACGADSPFDNSYPFLPSGQLSGSDEVFFGFDVGDNVQVQNGATIDLSMNPLRGTRWHDLMTYCKWIWISKHNYEAIRLQVEQENLTVDHTTANPPKQAVQVQTGDFLFVVATINLTKRTGTIRSTSRVTRATVRPEPESSPVRIQLIGKNESLISDHAVILRRSTDVAKGEDEVALVDAPVPIPPGSRLTQVRLVLAGKEIASLPISQVKPRLKSIEAVPQPDTLAATETAAILLRWDADKHGIMMEKKETLTYTVRISLDNGEHWQTLGSGLIKPELLVTANQLKAFKSKGAKKLLIKVIASDGFNTDEKVLPVKLSNAP